MSDLSYPVGTFTPEAEYPELRRAELVEEIRRLPAALRSAVEGLGVEQLDTPYRPDGWTVRQVVHHVADSHMNSFMRFKLALTEDNPTIKPYDEAAWAKLDDTRVAPPEASLAIVDALHERWVTLLGAMGGADFARTFVHPERAATMRLDTTLGLYAWHGRHHVAHITSLRARMGW
jgi:hypothetical protein